VRQLSDDVRPVNHDPFDGSEENLFSGTSLHISNTEWQLPIDIRARGKRDVEIYYVGQLTGSMIKANGLLIPLFLTSLGIAYLRSCGYGYNIESIPFR
jgi:hypothetical protein